MKNNNEGVKLIWTNETAKQITGSYEFDFLFAAECEFALTDLDYGIYKKFPSYSILALCRNGTN